MPRLGDESGSDHRLEIVILARDEAGVLGETLEHLRQVIAKGDVIHVVADRCTDDTARVAARGGARVWVRTQPAAKGKGAALGYWLDRTQAGASPDQAILILDADSRLDPQFRTAVEALLDSGARSIQLPIVPVMAQRQVVPLLAAFSEAVEHQVFERSRGRLGWPVRLRGTGMVFRRELLDRVGRGLRSVAEDLELTLRVAACGERIAYAETTCLYDPKPADAGGVIRQRARWLKGQLAVLRGYRREIWAIVRQGPSGWSLLASAFLRPKALILPLLASATTLLGMLAWRTSAPVLALLAVALAVPIILEAMACFLGLRRAAHRGEVARALLLWPAFGVAWLASILLAVASGEPWPRVRRSPPLPLAPDGRHAPESPWIA